MKEDYRNKWVVSKYLKWLLHAAIVLAVYMFANTLYLLLNRMANGINLEFLATGETSISVLFQVMILSHTGVGLLLLALMLTFGIAHLPKVWSMYKPRSAVTGVAYVIAGLTLGISGLFILTASASRDNNWVWWIHVICALLVPAGYILHRLSSRVNRPARPEFKRFALATVGVFFVLAVLHGLTTPATDHTGKIEAQNEIPAVREEANGGDFTPAGFVSPDSPFFPSASTTTTGGYLPSRIITKGDLGTEDEIQKDIEEYGFVKNSLIGATTCQRCHQDIVLQWEASAHRFASFNNPFYEATINFLRGDTTGSNEWIDSHLDKYKDHGKDGIGIAKSKWCSGCHDPALMLAGKMNKPVDRRSPEAQAGLTCLSCHAIDRIHDLTGNGNYNIADEEEDPYLFATSREGTTGAFLHDAALKAKPSVHMRQMLKPFFKESEYCMTCHKVSLPEPVNNYRWLRGQDEYDSWHDSGVALNASRTFYLPAFNRECQDCHMPPEQAFLGDLAAKNGMVKSHRFLAANTALPFIRQDSATIEKIVQFLRADKLSVDIFAVSTGREENPTMAIDHNTLSLPPEEEITVDVVVRNMGVGHNFPGGTVDSNEGWLEFTIKREDGEVLAISGYIDEKGQLDKMAHTYKAVFVDRNSIPIKKRNAQDIHATVYSNVITPGTSDIAHYSFAFPKELEGDTITLGARLLWRKFDRDYTEFAYNSNPGGFRQFDDVPELPISEIARDEVTLVVSASDTGPGGLGVADHPGNPSDWIRYNDYGIGLLLENDTRKASIAFEAVTELQPARLDGYLNLAKTALRDGNIEVAYQYLRECEDVKAGDPQVAWVWGRVKQEDGQYQDAIAAYNHVLNYFPDDRAAWRQLGRTYYLDQQYNASVEAYQNVLNIDPEDREAFYHLSLNYRMLGNEKEANKMEEAFRYYSIDESAAKAAQKYRMENPGDNLMAQDIRVHRLQLR